MKYLFSFLIFFFLLFNTSYSFGQEQQFPGPPETLKETKSVGERILFGFPEALKKPWQEAVVVWKKMADWFKDLWNSYLSSWLKNIWFKINSFLEKEVEKKKPDIKQGFEEEKQEMKEEIPKTGKSLWERLKELIK